MNHIALKLTRSLIAFIVFPVFSSYGQEVISLRVKDSLIRTLPSAKQDTNTINNLLAIAHYKMNSIDLFGNDKKKLQFDSIMSFVRRAEVLSKRLGSVKNQLKIKTFHAWYYFTTGDFEKGKDQLMMLIQHYKHKGDIYQEASTWSLLGDNINYNDTVRIDTRLHAYQQAYNLFKKGNYKPEQIDAYKSMADVHFHQGKLDLAEKELLEVLDQYRRIGNQKLHYTYDLLATVYRAKNDQKNELRYRLMMMKSMGNSGTIQQRSTLLQRVAAIYTKLGEFEKAYECTLKAINLYKNNVHDIYYYHSVCTAADALVRMGKHNQALILIMNARREKGIGVTAFQNLNLQLGYYYMSLKQYNRAEPYIIKAYNFFGNDNQSFLSKAYRARINISLANIKIYQRNFAQAKKFLLQAGSYAIKDPSLSSIYELAYSKVDSAQGRFSSAVDHFKKYKTINDSLYNITKSGQIAKLELEYETKEKEHSIKILRTEAVSQKATLDKVNLQRDIVFVALLILTLGGAISYRFYLYKQKNTRSILKNHQLIQSKNKQLNLLVEEKEWLLKEVHHRVKNNLHTIICLLESQAAFLHGDSLKVMENSQNRIYTMSLIHQKLYQSEDIKTIDMSVYIPELAQHLKDSFRPSSDKIQFNLQIEEIGLTQAIAIPIALIINEAITNSIKYAFPTSLGCEIMISLRQENQLITLELADNGIGMADHLSGNESNSLGLQLIEGLSKEIQGELIIKSEKGVSIKITFREHPWNVAEYHAEAC